MAEGPARAGASFADRIFQAIAVLGCGGILWFYGSGAYLVWRGCYPFPHGVSLQRVQQIAGMRFPAGTRMLHSFYQITPGESDLTAVLQMSPGEADALVRSVPVTRTSRTSRLGMDHPTWEHRHAWWTPDEPGRFLAIEADRSTRENRGEGVALLISRDDPQVATVYLLRWWGQPGPCAYVAAPPKGR